MGVVYQRARARTASFEQREVQLDEVEMPLMGGPPERVRDMSAGSVHVTAGALRDRELHRQLHLLVPETRGFWAQDFLCRVEPTQDEQRDHPIRPIGGQRPRPGIAQHLLRILARRTVVT